MYPSLPKLTSAGWVTPPPILPPNSNNPDRLACSKVNCSSKLATNSISTITFVLATTYWKSMEHWAELAVRHTHFRFMLDYYRKNRTSTHQTPHFLWCGTTTMPNLSSINMNLTLYLHWNHIWRQHGKRCQKLICPTRTIMNLNWPSLPQHNHQS